MCFSPRVPERCQSSRLAGFSVHWHWSFLASCKLGSQPLLTLVSLGSQVDLFSYTWLINQSEEGQLTT